MRKFLSFVLVASLFSIGYTHPLCSDTTTSVNVPNLQFCTQYIQNGSCCNYDSNLGGKTYKDVTVRSNFTSMGLTLNTPCGAIMQQIMCTKCDPWSAHLRGDISHERAVPFLCDNYCPTVFDACKDVAMVATFSPFGVNKISDKWTTQASFCGEFAAPGYCFNGAPYVDPSPAEYNSNQGLCLDRVVAQPIGSPYITATSVGTTQNSKLVLATREGIISSWRVTPRGAFINLGVFLNLTSRVWQNGEGGLLGMAYHPTDISRFFVSYICDPAAYDDCRWDRRCSTSNDCLHASVCLPSGRCGCTTASNCIDGGTCNTNTGVCMGPGGNVPNHIQMTIIAEYAVDPTNAERALPTEKKRVLAASRQGANHNGGQILFGPDGYLYIFMGDGGGNGARGPQSSDSFMGKVLRIDVNPTTPGYAIPAGNPWVGNSSYRPEIWAEGMRNPWRNSFDFTTGTLWNGDVGDVTIEEINQILPGKNYGWRKFEGSIQWNPDNIDPKPTRALNTPPKMSYTHESMRPNNGACVIGGYWYRGTKNTCWTNKYIFSDQLGAFFAGAEDGVGSGLYSSTRIGWSCGSDSNSPLKCNSIQLKSIFSMADDTIKNIYWLTDQGVMQLVESSRCPAIDCNSTTTGITATSATSAASVASAASATSAGTQVFSTTAASAAASTTVASSTAATNGGGTFDGDYNLACSANGTLPYDGGVTAVRCYICVEGGYDRINSPPSDESLIWVMEGITGTYNANLNGGLGFIHLFVDAGYYAQQTVQARLRYDFNGDGIWDRTEMFDKWPTNDLPNWEVYTLTNNRFFAPSTTGDFKPFTDGALDLTIWQASGSHSTSIVFGGVYDGHNSYVQIPYNLGDNCRYQSLGRPPGYFTSASASTIVTSASTNAVTTTATSATTETSVTTATSATFATTETSATSATSANSATTKVDTSLTSKPAVTLTVDQPTTQTSAGRLTETSTVTVNTGIVGTSDSSSAGRTRSSSQEEEIEESVAPVVFRLAMVLLLAFLI